MLVGQVDRRGKVATRDSRRKRARLDAMEHELGSPEHLEVFEWSEIAPGDVEKTLTALAVDRGPSKVDQSVTVDDVDIERPANLRGVRTNHVRWLSTQLNADVHVLHQ